MIHRSTTAPPNIDPACLESYSRSMEVVYMGGGIPAPRLKYERQGLSGLVRVIGPM